MNLRDIYSLLIINRSFADSDKWYIVLYVIIEHKFNASCLSQADEEIAYVLDSLIEIYEFYDQSPETEGLPGFLDENFGCTSHLFTSWYTVK